MSELEANLTVRDRINYNYILANQILTFQKAILALEDASAREIIESVEGLLHMIPENYKDEKFKQELEEAKIVRIIDNRPMNCGVKISEELCRAMGIEPYIKEEILDPFKAFYACINLLQRLGKLDRPEYTERMTMEKIEGEMIDDLKIDEV